jgi:hypothetical protein
VCSAPFRYVHAQSVSLCLTHDAENVELATPPRARSGRVVMGGVHTHHPVTVGAGNASTIANDGPVSQLFRQDSRGVQRTLTGKKWCPVWKEELNNEFPVPFGPGFV